MELNALFFGILCLMITVIAIIVQILSAQWDFIKSHEIDKMSYEEACNKLYKAMETEDDSFEKALCEYLSAKLKLEGVFSWSSWGKSIRMFTHFQKTFIALLASLSVFAFVYGILTLGFVPASGISAISILFVLFSVLTISISICWVISIYRCKILLNKKNNNIFPPEKEMLIKDTKVPDYCLVLLSRLLVSKNKKEDSTSPNSTSPSS